MKWTFVCPILLVVFFAAGAQAQGRNKKVVYSNVEDSLTGWGSCTTCAGGANLADVYWMAQFQSTPSRDGSSIQFYVSALHPYSDVLFWQKLGAQSWATQFTWDFWMMVDDASVGAQALEYDMFQFVGNIEYMFGTQCVYASGLWNVWNGSAKTWVPLPLTCNKFTPNVWHHIQWQVHRTPDTMMHYDTLTIDGVQNSINVAQPSGPLPTGWNENMGVQWQLDTASQPLSFNEWIDSVKLTIK